MAYCRGRVAHQSISSREVLAALVKVIVPQLIVPEGTIDYYNAVTRALGGSYGRTARFARLFMAPGVAHCAGGSGPQPQGLFDAVVNWVEHGHAPDTIIASKPITGGTQTRPLCPYPKVAVYTGSGSTDSAANLRARDPG